MHFYVFIFIPCGQSPGLVWGAFVVKNLEYVLNTKPQF